MEEETQEEEPHWEWGADHDLIDYDDIFKPPKVDLKPLNIVSREDWGADPGGEQILFDRPCEDVIYSYTETNPCTSPEECSTLMRRLQMLHKAEGHPDIKFNFVLGGDGNVYEGTGWRVRAPENPHYSSLSGRCIEFAHSGYRGDFPTAEKVAHINQLFERGIELKYISDDARSLIDYMWPTDGL